MIAAGMSIIEPLMLCQGGLESVEGWKRREEGMKERETGHKRPYGIYEVS